MKATQQKILAVAVGALIAMGTSIYIHLATLANEEYSLKVHAELKELQMSLDKTVSNEVDVLNRYLDTFENEPLAHIALRIKNLEPEVYVIQYIDDSGRLAYLESNMLNNNGISVPLLTRETLTKGGHTLPVGDAEGRFFIGIAVPNLAVGIQITDGTRFDALRSMRVLFSQCPNDTRCERILKDQILVEEIDSVVQSHSLVTDTGILIQADESFRHKTLFLADALILPFIIIMLGFVVVYLGMKQYLTKLSKSRGYELISRTYNDDLDVKNRHGLEIDVMNWSHNHTGLPVIYLIEPEELFSVQKDHGSEVSLRVLKEIRNRLIALVGDEHVYFIGGNQFAVLLNENNQSVTAEYVQKNLNCEYKLAEQNFWLTHSIGVASMTPGETKRLLLKQAKIALYEAKKQKNTIHRFCKDVNDAYQRQVELEQNLKRAIGNKELFVNYQLQVDKNQNIYGIEALARWNHPKQGIISPISFIPIAESAGLMPALGKSIYRQALEGVVELSNQVGRMLPLSVNVSPREFLVEGFHDMVLSLVEEVGYKPGLLTLEITETTDIDDIQRFKKVIKQLKASGFRLSLDDFGTGYSSLNLLASLPLDEVKIDRCFVMNAGTNNSFRQVIESIISIAKNLNVQVVSEGVETVEQRDLLASLGSDAYQGFLYCKPVGISDLLDIINGLKTDNNANVAQLLKYAEQG